MDNEIKSIVADVLRRAEEFAASGYETPKTFAPLPDTNLARLIDHTLLKPDAAQEQVIRLCEEAKQHHFFSVCVNPTWVALSAEQLQGSDVKVCTVIGFPLGANTAGVKAYETEKAIEQGAQECDMVINVGALKSRQLEKVAEDIGAVVQAAHPHGALVKVIIETSLLDDDEKVLACLLSKACGADFVKTSTGFSGGGATVADIALMRRVVGPQMGVKASGGVRAFEDASKLVAAGATRIGASAGIKIIQGPGAVEQAADTGSANKGY